jgi:hypothetical protein
MSPLLLPSFKPQRARIPVLFAIGLIVACSSAAHADPFGNLLKSALNVAPDCEHPRKMFDARREAERVLGEADLSALADVGAFCKQLRAEASRETVQCYAKCETDFSSNFQSAQEDYRRRWQQAEIHAQAEQKEAARKQAESDAVAVRTEDLKSGRAKPASLEEAMITYSATNGANLASAPKIRPDGRLYALHGRIRLAEDKPEFMASAGLSQNEELNINVNRIRAGHFVPFEGSTKYFKVVVPKAMRDDYFERAKIEGGFDVVGRYVSNTKYRTAAGEEKSAPVFEAVYLRLW